MKRQISNPKQTLYKFDQNLQTTQKISCLEKTISKEFA